MSLKFLCFYQSRSVGVSLDALGGVLRAQEAMDSIAYGCSRGVSGGCVLVFLRFVHSVS